MREVRLEMMEGWCWRMLMPALLVGGNAAGITLFLIGLLRVLNWRMHHSGSTWLWKTGIPWWIGYFVLQILGGLWSDDLEAWALSLEVKSALWFLPLLVAMPGRDVTRDFWWSVGWSMTFYILWRLFRAGWHQIVLDSPLEWSYARFTGDVHPTYFGLHATVAMLGLGRKWAADVSPSAVWTLTGLFALALGLSGSKAGILAAAAMVALQWVIQVRAWGDAGDDTGRHHAMLKVRLLCFLGLLFVAGWWMSRARFAEMGTAAAIISEQGAPVQSSSAGRVAVWQASLELIGSHPFGVGTGDVMSELMKLYARDGVEYALDRRLNPHNQWLQAGVAFGWTGMIVWTMALLTCMRTAWSRRDEMLMLCSLLVMLHAGVESILEVQRGVVFILWMLMALLPVARERKG